MMMDISIHALLAESDRLKPRQTRTDTNFYPRSPCGERRSTKSWSNLLLRISIHALLAESDWLELFLYYQDNRISIHALLAESDGRWMYHNTIF